MKQRRKYRPQSRKRAAPPYANTFIGFNYVQLNLPFFIFGKWGYTGKFSGVKDRAKSSSKAAPGVMIPIMVVPLLFPWYFEQMLHRFFADLQFSFYKGDGHTETYWLPAVVVVWFIYAAINVAYLEILYQLEWSPVGAQWVFRWTIELVFRIWDALRN